ncbi:MAG: DUF882 domain-containing protein [Aureispira sp.]|nr:DUF882 domain-containing protein [Aureispira sp.]
MKYYLLLLSLISLGACTNQTAEERYDEQHPQTEILSYAQIDSVLNSFPKLHYKDLDTAYLNYSDPNRAFEKKLKKQQYYVIEHTDMYKYLVGKYRIQNFLSKDKYYTEQLNNSDKPIKQYLLIDPKVLYRTLDLILLLEENGYNKYGFSIRYGHRHPSHNYVRGGASKSQHIYGKAIDIIPEDVNNDGEANLIDKGILLDLIDNQIIKGTGGVGRYPGSMSIHYDTRGFKRRWDSYTPHNKKKK